jgi:hypothetical protein
MAAPFQAISHFWTFKYETKHLEQEAMGEEVSVHLDPITIPL